MKNILRNTLFAAFALTGVLTVTSASADDNVYIWKGGHVIQIVPAAGVDKVSMASNNSAISVALKQGDPITAPTAYFDSITFVYNRPISDEVLDVQFQKDGTAKDISPFANPVEKVDGTGTLSTYYNDDYGCYVGKLEDVSYASAGASHYEIDYTDNEDVWNALADGYTVELLAEGTADANGKEAKWFSSTEAGGPFAVMVEKSNVLGFIAGTTETEGKNTWRWGTSTTTYEKDTYYHLVGVYDKDKQKVNLYVNGELVGMDDAPGELTKPVITGSKLIMDLFGDPSKSGGVQASFPGEIAIARIYNTPMTDTDVKALYSNIKKK